MLKEFAIDPEIMGSSAETCRYLISQFGVDNGRLISRFPRAWKRMALDAAGRMMPGRKQQQVVEYLNGIKNEWLMLVPSSRDGFVPEKSWLECAIDAHAAQPFDAIICDQFDEGRGLLDIDSCDAGNGSFSTARTVSVGRTAQQLALPAKLLLRSCRTLRIVDPYFDPTRPKWRNPLAAILALIPDVSIPACEYHLKERDGSPSTAELTQRLQALRDAIPAGGVIRIIRWRERPGQERFHRRYILTENAGLMYEGGLDEEPGAAHTTDISLMDRAHHAERWAEYNLDSQVYELFEPILIVDSEGNVSESR